MPGVVPDDKENDGNFFAKTKHMFCPPPHHIEHKFYCSSSKQKNILTYGQLYHPLLILVPVL